MIYCDGGRGSGEHNVSAVVIARNTRKTDAPYTTTTNAEEKEEI
jgi:hypothetical protein